MYELQRIDPTPQTKTSCENGLSLQENQFGILNIPSLENVYPATTRVETNLPSTWSWTDFLANHGVIASRKSERSVDGCGNCEVLVVGWVLWRKEN